MLHAYPTARELQTGGEQGRVEEGKASIARPLTHSLTHSLIHSLTHSLTHARTHSRTCALTHSLTHSLPSSLPPSPPPSLAHPLVPITSRVAPSCSTSDTMHCCTSWPEATRTCAVTCHGRLQVCHRAIRTDMRESYCHAGDEGEPDGHLLPHLYM